MDFVHLLVIPILVGTVATAQEAPVPQPTPAPTPAPAAPAQTSNYFNPSISVIGNFLAVGGTNEIENLPSASLRESELGFQAIVDPYARADFFISFSEEGANVEEGYLTFTSLPWDLLIKVGRMRTAFGKINTLHVHVWPWPDAPLPIVNLLGGEEGWSGDGVLVAKLIPLGDTFSEATLQVFRGESEGLFTAAKRSDLAFNGHYRVFRDLSDSTNLDLGLSYGFGPNGTLPDATTRLSALDATFRWKPLRTGLYRQVVLRGEFFRSSRDQAGGTESATGWFAGADYQFARRWWVGVRGEAAEHADDAAILDTGLAATLTFLPSEFSQLRSELRRRRYAGSYKANEILFQVQFAIGAHGAHPF
jgi:hypothetical protein